MWEKESSESAVKNKNVVKRKSGMHYIQEGVFVLDSPFDGFVKSRSSHLFVIPA